MSTQDLIQQRVDLLRRIREERTAAAVSEDNSAALAHLRMAEEYERRVGQLVPVGRGPAA